MQRLNTNNFLVDWYLSFDSLAALMLCIVGILLFFIGKYHISQLAIITSALFVLIFIAWWVGFCFRDWSVELCLFLLLIMLGLYCSLTEKTPELRLFGDKIRKEIPLYFKRTVTAIKANFFCTLTVSPRLYAEYLLWCFLAGLEIFIVYEVFRFSHCFLAH